MCSGNVADGNRQLQRDAADGPAAANVDVRDAQQAHVAKNSVDQRHADNLPHGDSAAVGGQQDVNREAGGQGQQRAGIDNVNAGVEDNRRRGGVGQEQVADNGERQHGVLQKPDERQPGQLQQREEGQPGQLQEVEQGQHGVLQKPDERQPGQLQQREERQPGQLQEGEQGQHGVLQKPDERQPGLVQEHEERRRVAGML